MYQKSADLKFSNVNRLDYNFRYVTAVAILKRVCELLGSYVGDNKNRLLLLTMQGRVEFQRNTFVSD
jgi:hypothetical protein